MSVFKSRVDFRSPRSLFTIASACLGLVFLLALWTSRVPAPPFSRNYETVKDSVLRGEFQELKDNIANATLGFEKIFVISLPRRTDHRDRLSVASKVSNLTFEYVDGVPSGTVNKGSLPAAYNDKLQDTVISAWRAHVNVLKKIVDGDVSSALIMEDDQDWDVRLKSVMYDLADPVNALATEDLDTVDLNDLPRVPVPEHSPYGDNWDAIWLGHCGMDLPETGIVLHHNDSTVPQDQDLRSFEADKPTPLSRYPQHTRAIFRRPVMGVCSLAYAVTQSTARKMLYDLGIEKLDHPYDIMLRGWCAQPKSMCLGVLPQVFDHFRRPGPERADSDINDKGDEIRVKSYSYNIRWSVQKNLRRMLDGSTDYEDQYPDG